MRLHYIGSRSREIAAPGRIITVAPGEVFEVGETLGRSLLEQTRLFRIAPEKNGEEFHVTPGTSNEEKAGA